MQKTITSISSSLHGQLTVPGDKSISHRTVMLGSLANGTSHVTGFLNGADCLSTINCFRQMGAEITLANHDTEVIIKGLGLNGLKCPDHTLDCGNSGTTTRLISGILSAQPFSSSLTGDESIQRRPMGRIIKPLSLMGAKIQSLKGNDCAPLSIQGTALHGIDYYSPVASAQVKSSILFAGLYASGCTSVTEPALSRNHSELMLQAMGADLNTTICETGYKTTIQPCRTLDSFSLQIPADISSAAYFIAAALIVPGSEIILKDVGINPTRDGILEVLKQMGADIQLDHVKNSGFEPTADLIVRSSPLQGTTISGSLIPRLIDELPVLAAIAAFAEGPTVIADAAELKVKESNRIKTVVEHLQLMGVDAIETEDGMIIHGHENRSDLHGAVIDTKKDHRIAMTFSILGLRAKGTTTIEHSECIDISYPGFYRDLSSLLS